MTEVLQPDTLKFFTTTERQKFTEDRSSVWKGLLQTVQTEVLETPLKYQIEVW